MPFTRRLACACFASSCGDGFALFPLWPGLPCDQGHEYATEQARIREREGSKIRVINETGPRTGPY